MSRRWRLLALDCTFDHMIHFLRDARAHPQVDLVGAWDADPAQLERVLRVAGTPDVPHFGSWEEALNSTAPDLVLLSPAYDRRHEWLARVAPSGAHVLLEKPFTATLAQAEALMATARTMRGRLAVNWALRWYLPHVTAHRLLRDGAIGELRELHFYDGNRGPVRDADGKPEADPEVLRRHWWWQPSAGGSLLDYLCYGAVFATWFFAGGLPSEITTVTRVRPGTAVDDQSVTIARYAHGLSTFQTRWGTFTDPWVHQPQPKCGFVLVGTKGTLSHYDYEPAVRLQTRALPEGEVIPVDTPAAPDRNPIEHVLHRLEHGLPFEGPLDPSVCLAMQRILETARLSAAAGRTLPLVVTAERRT